MDGQTSDRATKGRKEEDVMSRGVVPFSSSPSFAFSAIVAVSCFPGMLQRDGKEQGRGGATRGRVRGCQYFTCHSRVSPILLSFPRFLTLLRVKPTILRVAKSEMPLWKNDSMTSSTSFSMFPKRPLYPSLSLPPSPFRFLARFGTSAPLVGPSTTPRPGEPNPSLHSRRIRKRCASLPHRSVPSRPPIALYSTHPRPRTHTHATDNLASCRRFGNCYFCVTAPLWHRSHHTKFPEARDGKELALARFPTLASHIHTHASSSSSSVCLINAPLLLPL